jgi:hypothetical protein
MTLVIPWIFVISIIAVFCKPFIQMGRSVIKHRHDLPAIVKGLWNCRVNELGTGAGIGEFLKIAVVSCLCWIAIPCLLIGIIRYACDPEWRYALQYNVESKQVTIFKKPHDCERETAPLGNKNCHYEPVVTTVLTSINSSGQQIISYDNRKTWYFADPSVPVSPSVTVSWRRIDE